MKASKYNLGYEYGEFYIILNTYSKNIIRFPASQQNRINEILKSKNTISDEKIKSMLLEKGFLIPDDFDELGSLAKECENLVNSKVLYLTILPTYTCNLACTYCFQHHIEGAIISERTVNQLILAIKRKIKGYKALYIEWFGGEPLLAKEKVIFMNQKLKEICNNAKIPYVARMTTNGYYLDLDIFRQLFDNNCFVYYISLDGGKKLHDKQRPCKNGKSSYDMIMNNLIEIKNNIYSKNFRIEIRVNCSKAFLDIDEFMKNYQKSFGDDKRFSLILDTINNWSDRTEQMDKDGLLLGHSDLGKVGKIAQSYNVKLATSENYDLATQICQAAKKNAYSIFYDGTIHKCQMALESEEFRKKDIIGEITDDGIFYVNEEKEKAWVDDSIPKGCENCKLLPICFGKKCVFQTRIKKENCVNVEQKFIDSFFVHDASKIENIPLYTLNKGD